MADNRVDPGFDEKAFRELLERAMEIEQSRSERISEADLRMISKEIGVSVQSITRAIEERRGAVETVPAPQTGGVGTSWGVHFGALGVGLAAAYSSGNSIAMLEGDQALVGLVVVSALQLASVLLAAVYRGPAKYERFQLTNLLLWSGLGLGWAFLQVHAPYESSELVLASGLVCGVAGAATMRLLDKFRRPVKSIGTQPPQGSTPWRSEFKPFERVRSWINLFKRDRTALDAASPTSKPKYV